MKCSGDISAGDPNPYQAFSVNTFRSRHSSRSVMPGRTGRLSPSVVGTAGRPLRSPGGNDRLVRWRTVAMPVGRARGRPGQSEDGDITQKPDSGEDDLQQTTAPAANNQDQEPAATLDVSPLRRWHRLAMLLLWLSPLIRPAGLLRGGGGGLRHLYQGIRDRRFWGCVPGVLFFYMPGW
jgi:hypothetical protein